MKLFLQFEIGADGYLIDAQGVVAVLPLLHLKHVPHAPAGIAGTFNYRGVSVPALDLSQLALGTPAARNLSTRIILVPSRTDRLLGIIAQGATQALRLDPRDLASSNVSKGGALWLGPVASVGGRLLQCIDTAALEPA
jgi:chemotaxis-related protein WspB